MGVYQQYGVFLHPQGGEATLQADDEKRRYYENKQFTFLFYVSPPGVTAGPRDIDRDDSGVPKGPDGSTHDRAPDELTPDRQPVPWGFPMLGIQVPATTPRTAAVMRSMGVSEGQIRGSTSTENMNAEEERRVRGVLKDKGYTKEESDRVMARASGGGLMKPDDEVQRMHQQATLPGELVEKGVTRGLAGVDLTMPSPVPGISANDVVGTQGAIDRGEIKMVEREVGEGEVVMQRVATQPRAADPSDAPGSESHSAGTAQDRHAEVTTADQTRHQDVRAEAMREAGEKEGRSAEKPASSRPSGRSTPGRRR